MVKKTMTEKALRANRKNIKKANDTGKNIRRGADNHTWKNGVSFKKNYPCPQCGNDRLCVKGNSYRICKECHENREKKFDWNEWRRFTYMASKEWAIRYKGGKCKMCGVSDFPVCCYHFDHRNPKDKLFNLGHKFNQKINPEIIKELDKCDLYCANCHAIKTWRNEDVKKARAISISNYSS